MGRDPNAIPSNDKRKVVIRFVRDDTVFKELVTKGKHCHRHSLTQERTQPFGDSDDDQFDANVKIAVVEVTVELDRTQNTTLFDVWNSRKVKKQIRNDFPLEVANSVKNGKSELGVGSQRQQGFKPHLPTNSNC